MTTTLNVLILKGRTMPRQQRPRQKKTKISFESHFLPQSVLYVYPHTMEPGDWDNLGIKYPNGSRYIKIPISPEILLNKEQRSLLVNVVKTSGTDQISQIVIRALKPSQVLINYDNWELKSLGKLFKEGRFSRSVIRTAIDSLSDLCFGLKF
ncbi:hypothetical protein ACOME3_001889 [Neoechinorhynchus agilis]